ncbi:MAG: hypothetical protein CM15mP74_36260 [Halieaceae bacterium]|nr:MAG: hypothetical protein CM15mP74_36260 [Halieaceae bacterium]
MATAVRGVGCCATSIADADPPDLSLDAGDTVILSSKTIPGNEARWLAWLMGYAPEISG